MKYVLWKNFSSSGYGVFAIGILGAASGAPRTFNMYPDSGYPALYTLLIVPSTLFVLH